MRVNCALVSVMAALPIYEVDNVGVLQLLHDQDLVDDQLFLWLLLQVDLFDGHLQKTQHPIKEVPPIHKLCLGYC